MSAFANRELPVLGMGVSTEYGAGAVPGALDLERLWRQYPRYGAFLEVGVEVAVGLDADARRWLAAKRPTTYHFLDINLDEPEDFDQPWLDAMRALVAEVRPAWLCGDAGLWHFGRRERGHMLLLPPILTATAADALAAGVVRLRDALSVDVLTENPPGSVFLGDLHLLDFYARVVEQADTGMLLDCAHLAIYQRVMGHRPTEGLDRFPLERIIEIHVAGGHIKDQDGFLWVDDDHSPAVLEDTWEIISYVASRAPRLSAVVVECERNPIERCVGMFQRLEQLLRPTPFGRRAWGSP